MKALALVACALAAMNVHAQEPVRLYAAGSLRAALDEVARARRLCLGALREGRESAARVVPEAIGKGAQARRRAGFAAVPASLAVGADYGLTVMKGARPQVERFAQFILSRPGQDILAKHGFAPGDPR